LSIPSDAVLFAVNFYFVVVTFTDRKRLVAIASDPGRAGFAFFNRIKIFLVILPSAGTPRMPLVGIESPLAPAGCLAVIKSAVPFAAKLHCAVETLTIILVARNIGGFTNRIKIFWVIFPSGGTRRLPLAWLDPPVAPADCLSVIQNTVQFAAKLHSAVGTATITILVAVAIDTIG